MGCMMMRVCSKDTCPVGIATQNEELRKRFKGKPEHVMNFMLFVARQLREIMSMLGFRTVEEMVGRTDCLQMRSIPKARCKDTADLSGILDHSYVGKEKNHFDINDAYDFGLEKTLDSKVLIPEYEKNKEKLKSAGESGFSTSIETKVSSTDRSFGTLLGSRVTADFRNSLPDDSVTVNARGGGGQSFGAFLPKGVTLRLYGDANDGFGKGLSGGKLVVRPAENAAYKAHENIIIGNVALYGATSGKAYVCGVAGERFCVRNSGATAVSEGCGDHGLEYMTGGRAVILGMTGKNFAAGMSGGIAYVLDVEHTLYLRMNKDMASLNEVTEKYDIAELRGIIEDYVKETSSEFGREILDNFESFLPDFKKIIPNDYQRMLTAISKYEEQGIDYENAVLEAFKEVV
jgi:glutamate synthase (ferredoxin)